jgi:hypothetical protein
VTVGYERIKGLREKGQRRDGGYEASKSRTFNVPVKTLFDAFAKRAETEALAGVDVHDPLGRAPQTDACHLHRQHGRAGRLLRERTGKTAVAVQHQKLPDRAAVDATKKAWAERSNRLGGILS